MPEEAVAQRKDIGEVVGADVVLLDHLRFDLALLVHREERVVDHVAVIARDVCGGPDRVDDLEVGMHHHLERRLGAGRAAGQGECNGCRHCNELQSLPHVGHLQTPDGPCPDAIGRGGGSQAALLCRFVRQMTQGTASSAQDLQETCGHSEFWC